LEKQTVTARVARGDQEALVLNGTTRYRGSTQVVLQADLDHGQQGIAEVKFPGVSAGACNRHGPRRFSALS
jgi:hypothetical protein